MTTSSLDGKRVLVTGASGALGAATAALLASEGAHVAVHYSTHAESAAALVDRIARDGGRAVALQGDLLSAIERDALVPEAIARLGGLDALVNNAGAIVRPAHALELDEAAWDESFALNVKAPFFLARQAFQHMAAHGGGRIINLSSIGVKFGGSPTSLHYSAAKHALEGVTLGLAKLGAERGVLVNAVRAGVIDTPMHAARGPEAMERRRQQIPMKRFGTPGELARMIAFLIGPGGDFVTGQTFAVSGGE